MAEEAAPMLLTDLPRELIVVIRNHFLNDEKERDDDGGAFVEVEGQQGELKANDAYDPKLAQGLPIAFKLVCTSFRDVLRCNVESPLLSLCTSHDMLQWTRRTWNPTLDPIKDVRMVQRILEGDGEGLKAFASDVAPAWHAPQVLSEHAVTYGHLKVLEWMRNRVKLAIDFDPLARRAVDYMQGEALKWLVATGKTDVVLTENQLCALMYYAIEHGNWDMVQQVHDGMDGFDREEEAEVNDNDNSADDAYQNMDSYYLDSRDTDDENDALWEQGAPIGQFQESGARTAWRNKQSLAVAQRIVDQGASGWSAADYGRQHVLRKWFMETYRGACPVAAEFGKLATLRHLASLGYRVTKWVMMMALVHGHLDVAKWAEEHSDERCTVKDMIENNNWDLEQVRKCDFYLDKHMNMSAYKHMLQYDEARGTRDREEHERKEAEKRAQAEEAWRQERLAERELLRRQIERARERKRKRDAEIEEDRAKAMKEALRFVADNPLCERCGNTRDGTACCRRGY